jgi:CHAT domain
MNAKPIKILILTANPVNTPQLRLGEEVRSIQEGLERAKYRDRFQVISKQAVRTTDLRRALLDCNPQIVHFAGHGEISNISQADLVNRGREEVLSSLQSRELSPISENADASWEGGLVLEDEMGQAKLVGTEALAQLFSVVGNSEIECVLLNACYSEVQANAIHQSVDCVIGMNQPIGDMAAIRFSQGFYDALGSGQSYEDAYKIGCSAIELEGSSEYSTPVLKYRKRRNANFLVDLDSTQLDSRQAAIRSVEIVEPSPKPPQSQLFGNVTISGSNNPFNAIQAAGNVSLSQRNTQSRGANLDLEAALAILLKLRQDVLATDALSSFVKKDTESKISMLQEELQKPEPDKSFVNEVVDALKQALSGVLALAGPVTQVATLLAKARVGLS